LRFHLPLLFHQTYLLGRRLIEAFLFLLVVVVLWL
jgi:hypothetical protein